MAPPASRYGPNGPNNPSNPFAGMNFNQNPSHQASHMQHPGQNFQAQNLGGHQGFANPSLGGFFSSTGNAALGAGFQPSGALGGGGAVGLGSHAAQMSFEHGATLQQQQQQQQQQARAGAGGVMAAGSKAHNNRVRDVWRSNLREEFILLRSLISKYTHISMDTEFPGIVTRPIGDFPTKADYHYQTVRSNVDLLKIIQLGITLFTPEGEIPPAQVDPSIPYQSSHLPQPCTWQFNLQFSTDDDMYNEESINVLIKSGLDFGKHATQGIDPAALGSLLITSGLTFEPNVNWISFHSGYDFAYVLKVMWQQALPDDEAEYRKLVKVYFPRLIDIKFLLRSAQKRAQAGILSQHAASVITGLGGKTGLQDLAEELGCQRVGIQHTAGSDAWLTGLVFFKMKERIFDGHLPPDLYGEMWGLTGVGPPASSAMQAAALAAQGHVNGGMGGMNFHGGGPSTPTSSAVGLASTPGPQGHMGTLTPGPYGGYQYGGK